MKLFLHQAKHELWQIGWGLLVWAAAGLYLAFSPTNRGGAPLESISGMLLMLVSVMLVMLFGGALVAKTVQLDAPYDSSAFWRTRPLSSLRLLGTKLSVLIGIFVVLPLIVAACKTSQSASLWADLPRGFIGLLALVLANAALGAVTKDLGRYLLGILALFFVSTIIQASAHYASRGANLRAQSRAGAGNIFIEGGFIILVSLAILIVQYRFRRPWISYGLVVVGVIGFGLLRRLTLG